MNKNVYVYVCVCVYIYMYVLVSLVAQMVKHLPAMRETQVHSLVWEDPWRREWQPTPVFLPGEFQRSLAGYRQWDRKEVDLTEVTWHACLCTHTHTHTHTHIIKSLCSTAEINSVINQLNLNKINCVCKEFPFIYVFSVSNSAQHTTGPQ